MKCARCDKLFIPGWSLDSGKVDEDEWEPEAYCSEYCYEQYYQYALDPEA